MANITIPYLVGRTNKRGVTSWYWQPSAALARAGWKPVALGKDESAAINAARTRNTTVTQWQAGAAQPNDVRRHVESGTVGALIRRYRRDVIEGKDHSGKPRIAASTARTYSTALKRLDIWAGTQPLAFVTPARVKALKNAMLHPVDGIGHDPAHKTLKVGRQLFQFAIECDLVTANPFANFNLAAPPPRDVIWSAPAREAMVRTADAAGMPSMALAITLGFAIAQREGDLLALTRRQWVPIPQHKVQPHDWPALVALAPDGVPMGIRIRQGKTKAWIEVPVVGDVRARVESALARAATGNTLQMVIDDTRSAPTQAALYSGVIGQTRFQRDFAAIRESAIARATTEGDAELAIELATLQFRDLRRTAVVYLGELGLDAHQIAAITGHDLDTTQRILKTYMPTTTGKAASVVVLTATRSAEADQLRRDRAG